MLSINRWLPVSCVFALGACATEVAQNETVREGTLTRAPEAVVALAAPYQNLDAVTLRSDGCYWYEHVGPVETTLLPLRSVNGRAICTRSREASSKEG